MLSASRILDQKLSWRAHIDARCGEAKRLLFCSKRYLGLSWGVSESRLASLYVAAVESCLLYGCSLWCAAALTRRNRSALRWVQRLLCIMCVRAFRTSPTLALKTNPRRLQNHGALRQQSSSQTASKLRSFNGQIYGWSHKTPPSNLQRSPIRRVPPHPPTMASQGATKVDHSPWLHRRWSTFSPH